MLVSNKKLLINKLIKQIRTDKNVVNVNGVNFAIVKQIGFFIRVMVINMSFLKGVLADNQSLSNIASGMALLYKTKCNNKIITYKFTKKNTHHV